MKALGWSVGNACVSLIETTGTAGGINIGDVGIVIGPGLTDGNRISEHLLVDFGAGKGKVNLHAKRYIITKEEYAQRRKVQPERFSTHMFTSCVYYLR